MKQLLLCFGVLATISLPAQESSPSLNSQFPLKWKAKIGGTTFKTNFAVCEGMLVVGSNGDHYRDWRLDYNNGVYFINPANGRILHRAAQEGFGDMDVNGVAAHNGNVFLGNDNDEFFCYDTCARLIWRVPVSGDVESEPVLVDVNRDGVEEVIFGTESGEVAALDSKNGNTVWRFKIKDFSGWDKTDNRLLFKVGAYFAYGSGFMSKPAIADLNGDKVDDLIYNCRDNYTYALNGANGTLLWKFNHGENGYMANSPLVVENGAQKNIYLLQTRPNEKNWLDQHIVSLTSAGVLQKTYPATWNYSINYTPVYDSDKLLSIERDTLAVVNLKSGVLQKVFVSNQTATYAGNTYSYAPTITARPQFFDFLKTGNEQLLLIDQGGLVQLLDANTFRVIKKFSLPSGSETTPLIADINEDGKMEMLVSCYDGYLYCYDLKTSAGSFTAKK